MQTNKFTSLLYWLLGIFTLASGLAMAFLPSTTLAFWGISVTPGSDEPIWFSLFGTSWIMAGLIFIQQARLNEQNPNSNLLLTVFFALQTGMFAYHATLDEHFQWKFSFCATAFIALVMILRLLPWQSLKSLKGSNRHSGTVKWFNPSKGFGFITGDDGEEIFVHHRSIRSQNGPRRASLREGQAVTFIITMSEKGKQADDVTVTSKS